MPSLNGNWKLTWKAIEGTEGVPECDRPIDGLVPGDVHDDLVRAGLLPEPLVAANAPLHEWVERAVFTYEREFEVEDEFDRAELVFNGLDYFAEVFIDGEQVGKSANAFVPHTFDVTPFVKNGKKHALRVTVDTGVVWAKQQDGSRLLPFGEPERAFLRKSQFSFRWDWAPRLVTCGVWRDVDLKLYRSAVLRDVMLTPTLDGAAATLSANVQIEALKPGDYIVKMRAVRGPGVWQATQGLALSEGTSVAELSLTIDPVERWWPAGYGDQALYSVEVELESAGDALDSYKTTYGFREITVKQEPVAEGETSFIVNVNGVDVFCKGADWVPADSIVARVTDEKYDRLVSEAVEANFNMFRIWGGGIYEADAFYDFCDRYGVMVWHDFMFACAEYPEDEEWFVENIRDEAAKAVRRLRDHTSIALWCGNNENDWAFGYWGRGKGTELPPFFGTRIYHDILPEICASLDPTRFYWPSSPYGGTDPNCEQLGDRHAWDVSILDKDPMGRADIRNYRKDRGKFNSEYGVLSYALPRTILDYTQESKIDLASEASKPHDNTFNASGDDGTCVDRYLKIGFGSVPTDDMTYIMQSLAYQAMGYREAISDFRIRKFDCAGSLFWMYSDCWGTHGWTIIDYYLRRKPSFFWVKKAYAPVAVFVRVEDDVARTYVVNDTTEEMTVGLTLEVASLHGEGKGVEEELVVPANGVAVGPDMPAKKGYAYARIEREGWLVSEDLILTRFPSEMKVPKVNIKTKIKKKPDHIRIEVTSDGFGHFVYLDLPDEAVASDNYFNLIPSRTKVVQVTGCDIDEVRVGALNLSSESAKEPKGEKAK